MLELLLCASITVLPDYLYRRYVQGKRIGREITFYTVWYELRWGITTCLFLTISLITLVFYFHPSTTNVTALFRTVTILPDRNGRVAEVYVGMNQKVNAGDPLFRLDSSEQEAAVETAKRRVAEIEAQTTVTETQLAQADAQIQQAQASYKQARDEYETRAELAKNKASTISQREVDRARVTMEEREAGVAAEIANKQSLETQISSLLPAQKASAEAALQEAQVALDQSVVRAGVDGIVQQFVLRPGDVVNPMIRTAGFLVPENAGRAALIAGFGQIEAQVLKPGMIAEATCAARPMEILPMVVTQVQDVIAAGQVRQSEQLIDVQQTANQPGTITAYLEPLFKGGLAGVPPGSNCIANAYTNNHDALEHLPAFSPRWIYLHVIDTVGLVHALILRMQAALLPVQTLVLSGGH